MMSQCSTVQDRTITFGMNGYIALMKHLYRKQVERACTLARHGVMLHDTDKSGKDQR